MADGGASLPGGAGETLLDMRFPAEVERLHGVRDEVRRVVSKVGLNEQEARDVVLAVDEACCNAIIHTYQRRKGPSLELTVTRNGDDLRFVLRDFGPPVPVETVKPRSLDDLKPGGLGTHFIKTIMDSVRFLPAPSGPGNVLEMTKKLKDPS